MDRCIKSLEGEYDELIIEESNNRSMAQCINAGIEKAKGDFFIISNDDITLRSGHLKDLCHSGEVHSPINHGGVKKTFHAHIWCLPRDVYERIGDMDETCPSAYYIDSDYWVRLVKEKIPVLLNESVHIDHPEPGRTLKHTNEKLSQARDWFIAKHGKQWLGLVE